MEPITLHKNQSVLQVKPKHCSFYISLGVSLLQILIQTKTQVHLWQQTVTSLINLLDLAREYGREAGQIRKFAVFYQTLLKINEEPKNLVEEEFIRNIDKTKYLAAIDICIRCIMCCLFPDESNQLLARTDFSITPNHIQALSEALNIHLSLALQDSYETYYCMKSTALLVFFYKSEEGNYSIAQDFANYKLFYTHIHEIPPSLTTALNLLSKLALNNEKRSSAILALQRACIDTNDLLSTDIRNFIKNTLPAWTGVKSDFLCQSCLQSKNEVKFSLCKNQCDICAACASETACVNCDEVYFI